MQGNDVRFRMSESTRTAAAPQRSLRGSPRNVGYPLRGLRRAPPSLRRASPLVCMRTASIHPGTLEHKTSRTPFHACIFGHVLVHACVFTQVFIQACVPMQVSSCPLRGVHSWGLRGSLLFCATPCLGEMLARSSGPEGDGRAEVASPSYMTAAASATTRSPLKWARMSSRRGLLRASPGLLHANRVRAPASVAVTVARLGGRAESVGKLGDVDYGRTLASILGSSGAVYRYATCTLRRPALWRSPPTSRALIGFRLGSAQRRVSAGL